MTTPALGVPRRHARLGRYAFWQIGDFALGVALVTIVLFVLIGTMSIMAMHVQTSRAAAMGQTIGATQATSLARIQFETLLSMFTYVVPLIALSGFFSTDRSNGYTRFLFAKPLSAPRYYAQTLVIRFVGVLVLAYLLAFAWAAFAYPTPTWKLAVVVTGYFATIGGVAVLLSALTKYDGLGAIVWLIVSAIIWEKWGAGTGVGKAFTYLVPPIGKLGDLQSWLLNFNAVTGLEGFGHFPAKWFWWNAGYGVACMLLGFVLLTRRSLIKT